MANLDMNTTSANFVLGKEVVPIEDSYDKDAKYQSVVERYFTVRYVLGIGALLGDYNVMFHSNRICVVTLAPTHFLIGTKQNIVSLDFQVTGQINFLESLAKGKRKRGAQSAEYHDSFLFYVKCEEGHFLGICAGIPGKVIEINKALLDDPNIMTRDPWGKGYLAVIEPTITNYQKYKEKMLTAEQAKEQKKSYVEPEFTEPVFDINREISHEYIDTIKEDVL